MKTKDNIQKVINLNAFIYEKSLNRYLDLLYLLDKIIYER